MKTDQLKQYSLLTWFLERLFFRLQYLSIGNLLFKTRVEIQKKFNSPQDLENITKKRGKFIEIYILTYFLLLLVSAFFMSSSDGWLKLIIVILPTYRIIEIVIISINMNLFDSLRLKGQKHYVSSATRTLILSIWNFCELIFCFALIYSSNLANIKCAHSVIDAYYFSVITQLTIGYGDLTPLNNFRILASLQGLLGYLFIAIVLSRFITLLPKIETVQDN